MTATGPVNNAKVSVLGPAVVDGEQLTERQRPLVAALALHRGDVVPTDLLVEAVWTIEAPDTARQSLQNQVRRLRRDFGPALIETAPGGYRLGTSSDVDIVDEQLKGSIEGSDALDEVARLDATLALWRGVPFADLFDLPEAEPERARLELLKERTLERLALALINAGDIDRAVVELEDMVRADPLRERRWELLMSALQLDGRRTEALAAFDNAAACLTAELGVAPSAQLVSLRERIASSDMPVLPGVASAGVRTSGRCGARSHHRTRCLPGARN